MTLTDSGKSERLESTPESSGAKKEPQSQKNRTDSAKEFSDQFKGVAGHYPLKQGF